MSTTATQSWWWTMAGFDLKEFRGQNWTRDPRLLDLTEAQDAAECVFDGSGALRPWNEPWETIHSFGSILQNDVKTIYRYDNGTTVQWKYWLLDVELARGPMATDTLRRVYLTGDGVPKMSYNTLFPTFRTLGIAAPGTKPTVSATLPETALAGTITQATCSNLKMIHECRSGDGRNSGFNETNIIATTSPVALSAFPVGARVKVASIVDINNVTVTGVGDINYSTPVDKLDYGLRWTNSSGDRLWKRRKKAYWNFLIPSGATLAIANHGLQVGDVLQITATSSVMSWQWPGSGTVSTSPNTDQYSRTATWSGGNVVFTGDCNFIIDRGGATIDPLSPAQNYVVEQRVYVYTWVTDIGEESAPSPASDIVAVAVGDPVAVGGFAGTPTNVTHRRIYRSNTGSDGTELQFVTEIPIATTSYNDTLDPSALGEVIPSENWEPPPANLRGICAMANGSMAGFYDNFLCFSEPGYPHAWPPEYRYPVDYPIVTIAPFGNSVCVGTESSPYVFTGQHPRQMASRRIPVNEPALGLQSAINIGDYVCYTSINGIIAVNEQGARNIIKEYIPETIWRGFYMDARVEPGFNVRGYLYGNTLEYALKHDSILGDSFVSLTFNGDRIDVQRNGRSEYTSFCEPADQSLHRLRTQLGGNNVYVQVLRTELDQTLYDTGNGSIWWDGSSNTQWLSKRIVFDRPLNLAWGRVVFDYAGFVDPKDWASTYLTIRFFFHLHNGTVQEFAVQPALFAEPVYLDQMFRLPGDYLVESVEVSISADAPIRVKRLLAGETIEDVL